jgi:hypothetical protein
MISKIVDSGRKSLVENATFKYPANWQSLSKVIAKDGPETLSLKGLCSPPPAGLASARRQRRARSAVSVKTACHGRGSGSAM